MPRNDTGVVIDSEPHPESHMQNMPRVLLFIIAVRIQAGCFTFPFYNLTKPLIQLYSKYKIVFSSIKNIFYSLDINNKNVNISNKFIFF